MFEIGYGMSSVITSFVKGIVSKFLESVGGLNKSTTENNNV